VSTPPSHRATSLRPIIAAGHSGLGDTVAEKLRTAGKAANVVPLPSNALSNRPPTYPLAPVGGSSGLFATQSGLNISVPGLWVKQRHTPSANASPHLVRVGKTPRNDRLEILEILSASGYRWHTRGIAACVRPSGGGRSMGIALNDGSRVGIIGGGPAGSLCAYFLLNFAQQMDLDLALTSTNHAISPSRGQAAEHVRRHCL
jgi:hypothetical protein